MQTLTFKTLYVLVLIAHGRRELVHINVTAHPAAAWIWRQLVEATPWGLRPRFLLRDRDAVYGGDFGERAAALDIEPLLAPVRAPRANAVAERVIGTLRRECLDHMIVLNERHLRSVLLKFARYYNRDRPHRSLRLRQPLPVARPGTGPIRARPVLGGLHHAYERGRCSEACTTRTSASPDHRPTSALPQQYGYRFALDFLPFLGVPVALGLRLPVRPGRVAVFGLLLLFSAVSNLAGLRWFLRLPPF